MRIAFILFLAIIFVGCSGDVTRSENPLSQYFYPLDNEPVIYLYRDKAKGLDERFHRIYRIDDSFGKHLVVEIYSAETRLLEAYNYNVDSLDLMDHMVVDRNLEKQKGELGKTKYFPWSKKGKGEFMSRFPGPLDSTLVVYEVNRKVHSKAAKKQKVLDEMAESIVFSDDFTFTLLNAKGKEEAKRKGNVKNVYAEGYGLVRWYDDKKEFDFVLEKIMTEEEWIKLLPK
jgi:hypothetical protein